MVTYVIWIDMNLAKIFKVSLPGKKAPKLLRRREIKHHTSSDPENHKDCEKFFHSVARELCDADELFITGPSLAKEHFKAHLSRHHHDSLAKKVVGTRSLDHVTNNGILELSREFFRIYDTYGTLAVS